MDNATIFKIIQDHGLLIKSEENSFFFTSDDAHWIFDFRKVFMQGKLLQAFVTFFWDKYESEYPFQVGGLELGAIPLIAGIVLEGSQRGKDMNSFFVRKERKISGLGNQIEGNLDDTKIIIVDDLFNSGATISKIQISLQEESKEIYKIFTFINFGNPDGNIFLEKNNLNLEYEFTLSDFGLDIFGNARGIKMDHQKGAMIFPDFQKLCRLKNANQFLEVPKSNPLAYKKNIIIAGEGGKISSVCRDTGRTVWEFSVSVVSGHKNILSSPLHVENMLVFGSYDGNLYCLDIDTGIVIWKAYLSDWIGSSPCYSEKQKLIFIGLELGGPENKGSLAAININDGTKQWEILCDDYVHASPGYIAAYDLVICGGNDGKLNCVRADSGKILYTRQFPAPIKGAVRFSQDGKQAYFGCFDNNIYAIDTITGQKIWNYKTDNMVYATPELIGDNIIIGSMDKHFYHLNSAGQLQNKVKTFGKIFAPAIQITSHIIALGSNDSYIYFYDLGLKELLFVIEHKNRINSKLVYNREYNHLYVYDFLNNLTKYDLNGFIK